MGENKVVVVVVVVATIATKVDKMLLLVLKSNQRGSMRFNPIPEVSNQNKDEEPYHNEEETEDIEWEDEFYGLLVAPRAWSTNRTDRGVLCQPTPRSKADGILMSVMSQATLLSKERRHQSYMVTLKVKALPM